MQYRWLIAMMIVVAGCGDDPDTESFEGAWRLTSVNTQPLPAPANTFEGRMWLAGVLQLAGDGGSFDWCWEDTATSTQSSTSDYVVLNPISGERVEVSYFGRREPVPDTATVNGSTLTLRARSVSVGGAVNGIDVLKFVRMTGEVPAACSLAP
jgi:hypothetical protein